MLSQMFRKLRKRKDLGTAYAIGFHVKPAKETIMPSELGGAYVHGFCKASTQESAAQKIYEKLLSDGLIPEEILPKSFEMNIEEWTVFAIEYWPEYVQQLHTQEEFEEIILGGGVVYGPFSAYNPQ